MINVTDAARDKLSNIIAAQPTGDLALRLSIMGRGVDSFAYDIVKMHIDLFFIIILFFSSGDICVIFCEISMNLSRG